MMDNPGWNLGNKQTVKGKSLGETSCDSITTSSIPDSYLWRTVSEDVAKILLLKWRANAVKQPEARPLDRASGLGAPVGAEG